MLDRSLDDCLRRIAEQDGEVRAWSVVSPQVNPIGGPLSGVPYGAKDIIETCGLPTEYGSSLYKGRIATEDAAIITALREMGAVLVGKTHTTAFASFDPAPTRNPKWPGHTPGGSSSGSAAAVAAGMVRPLAIGSQTLGSVLRPASYCGVCGFKPTFGRIPTAGVLAFAPSQDTLGFFTATAADMAEFWRLSFGKAVEPSGRSVKLADLGLGDDWERLTAAAFLINDYEGAHSYEQRYCEFGERLGTKLAALVRRGLAAPSDEYRAAKDHVAAMRERLGAIFREYDFILSDAATGPPPAGYDTTGDPAANAPWTALGTPAICVPRSPVGLQVTAAWNHDDALVAFAATM